jgi:hypothetical protein
MENCGWRSFRWARSSRRRFFCSNLEGRLTTSGSEGATAEGLGRAGSRKQSGGLGGLRVSVDGATGSSTSQRLRFLEGVEEEGKGEGLTMLLESRWDSARRRSAI